MIINGKNALTEWGVRMGDGFLDALGASVPVKDAIENKSRLEHGKRIIPNTKLDERELILTFTITGSSKSDFEAKKESFYTELYKVLVDIQIDGKTYHLQYIGKSITYGQNLSNTFAKYSAKFCEYNPAVRV